MTGRTEVAHAALGNAERLAFERTRAAYNRSVLAAVRTGTTLITFGFTLYKFFQLEMPDAELPGRLLGPREFGFLMIFIGLASIVLGSVEYRRDLKLMRKQYPEMPWSSAGFIAGLMSLLGLVALGAVIFRQ